MIFLKRRADQGMSLDNGDPVKGPTPAGYMKVIKQALGEEAAKVDPAHLAHVEEVLASGDVAGRKDELLDELRYMMQNHALNVDNLTANLSTYEKEAKGITEGWTNAPARGLVDAKYATLASMASKEDGGKVYKFYDGGVQTNGDPKTPEEKEKARVQKLFDDGTYTYESYQEYGLPSDLMSANPQWLQDWFRSGGGDKESFERARSGGGGMKPVKNEGIPGAEGAYDDDAPAGRPAGPSERSVNEDIPMAPKKETAATKFVKMIGLGSDEEPSAIPNSAQRKQLQMYFESSGNPNADSGYAKGLYGIAEGALADAVKAGIVPQGADVTDPEVNEKVRDYYIDKMYNTGWVTNATTNIGRLGRAYAAYNQGGGNALRGYESAKTDGFDINPANAQELIELMDATGPSGKYDGYYWPKETRDYVKGIVAGQYDKSRVPKDFSLQ